ncbi:MAG TPA: hypothetical protein VLZ74_16925 [Methylocella sp.]|nr:hypothetical protein [Methylocella sp.]
MSSPTKTRDKGIPVGLLIGVLGTLGVLGLVGLGVKGLIGSVKLVSFPLAGEWQAKGRPWRMEFRPDKTVVSSAAPSQSDGAQAWTSEQGTYKVDYFGNLWVMLKNGKTYSAELAPPPEALASAPTNRFDLIESGTEAVTVFEKMAPANPAPADSKPR